MTFSPKGDKLACLISVNSVQLIDISSPMARNEGLKGRSRHAPWAPELILGPFGARCATISEGGVLVPVTQIRPWTVDRQYQRVYMPTSTQQLAQLPPTALGAQYPAYLTITENWLLLGRIRLLYVPCEWEPTWMMSGQRYPNTGICSAVVRGDQIVWGTRCCGIATLAIDLQHLEIAKLRSNHVDACEEFEAIEIADTHYLPLPEFHPSNGVIWTSFDHYRDELTLTEPWPGQETESQTQGDLARNTLGSGRSEAEYPVAKIFDSLMTAAIQRPTTPKIGPLTGDQMAACMAAAYPVRNGVDYIDKMFLEIVLMGFFTPGLWQDQWLKQREGIEWVYRRSPAHCCFEGFIRFPADDERLEPSADLSSFPSDLPPAEPLD